MIQVTVHPKYNDALFDLALMRTERDVEFGKHVQPICLPFGPYFPDIRTDAVVYDAKHLSGRSFGITVRIRITR